LLTGSKENTSERRKGSGSTADSFEIHRRRVRCVRAVRQHGKGPGAEYREESG
jgi:hypothetical protein